MGWLSGYQYRKTIVISGQAGAGTNYQIPLSIGSSFGGNFNLGSKAKNFPYDLRFTSDNGTTQLDYWIEDATDDPIWAWVEIPDDLTSNLAIYSYYGKDNDTSMVNGSNTFIFFDDFSILDTSIWDDIAGSPNVSMGAVYFTSSDRIRASGLSYKFDIAFRANIEVDAESEMRAGMSISPTDEFMGLQNSIYFLATGGLAPLDLGDMRSVSVRNFDMEIGANSSSCIENTEYIIEAGWNSSNVYFTVDNAILNIHTYTPNDYLNLRMEGATQGISQCKWYLIRKFVYPEPAFSHAGAEEYYTESNMNYNFKFYPCR